MRFNPSARTSVVHQDIKEANLIDLMQRDLSARRLIGGAAARGCYRLVTRSPESPAARALGAVAADALSLGLDIRVIFVRSPALAPFTDVPSALAGAACRIISDPRVLDAHEQLVLSSRTAWIGDCMRRDPGKRDAYECTCENCEWAAGWAARSFESLWAAATPADFAGIAKKLADAPAAEIVDASLLAASDTAPDLVTILH